MLTLSEATASIVALIFLVILYFTLPVLMIWVPSVVIGCNWPIALYEIIKDNAQPQSIIAWWTELIEKNGPVGWSLQLNQSDGQYISCVKDHWWDLLILTTGVVLPFMTIGMLFIYLVSMFFAFLIRKAL